MTDPILINDRYQILRPLGRGGLGQTDLALDTWQQRHCALKEFAPGPSISANNLAKAQQLFAREAQVLRQLNHPQIPAYLDSFSWKATPEEQPRLFLVQQYIDGETYQQHLQRRPFSEAQLLQFLQDILPVLGYLHGHNPQVIHRDIAPDNLIFDPDLGKPVLIDFGSVKQAIATVTASPADLPQAASLPKPINTIIAKAGFTAPEQAHGMAYPSSDLYALGMSAIALLTGNGNPAELAPHHWQNDLCEGVARLIQRMAHPIPQQRFASASEVLLAIQALSNPSAAESPKPNRFFPIGPKTTLQKVSPYELRPPAIAEPNSNSNSNSLRSPLAQGTPRKSLPGAIAAISQTIAVGRPEQNSTTFTSQVQEIYPWYLLPLIKTQPILAFLLYRLVAPSVVLLCLFGLGRAALLRVVWPQLAQIQAPRLPSPKLPAISLPEFSLPKISLPKLSLPSGQASGADCRQAVLDRADDRAAQGKSAPNWGEVDRRFRDANPSFTAAIDPENPEHLPYIQSWCGIANQWLDEEN
jgi:serine/threonine protein kinase